MRRSFTRRVVITSGLAAAACAPTTSVIPYDDRTTQFHAKMLQVEQRAGGRVGVVALNTANNVTLSYRADERFAMCSMFKWLLAAQILQMDMHMPGFLAQQVHFNEVYLANLGHAPVTRANVARGWMTVEQLAEAAVTQSDNGAANLLLEGVMGPAGLTRFLRANGDSVTRLDRNEPSLNENVPGDVRDTTTPNAMAHTMVRFLTTDTPLNPTARVKLTGWLVGNQTGGARLRAGLPADWRVGDKTGASDGDHNATTDVAICWSAPASAPIVIACFLSESTVDFDARNAAHADVARTVVQTWS
ncbi:MAG: class A beta-lactamase [Proteobacteria bacterium]|nr:class A beta-lactamase [Pseudomonadota bacterium]